MKKSDLEGATMRIGFFLDKEKYPYEGVVRPFINWAKELSKSGLEIHFLLLNCDRELTEFVKDMNGIKYKISKNLNEIIDYINKTKLEIILTDDNFRRLRLVTRIKNRTRIKTGIYIQILFGVHSIVDVFNLKYLPIKEQILFKFVRIFPFSLLKVPYKKLLQKQDLIIANSQITATLLHVLYGAEPHGIVYPPVDTEIFKPHIVKKKNQILLYLGSHAGDTDENFIKEVCEILKNKKFEILAIGNEILKEKLSEICGIYYISGISDKELAKIYSESKLVICPQKWEQFGYVIAEAIACGTPVLAFNMMGPKEIIEHANFGLLADNKKKFLKYLSNLELYLDTLEAIKNKKPNELEFDIRKSAMKLVKVIKDV